VGFTFVGRERLEEVPLAHERRRRPRSRRFSRAAAINLKFTGLIQNLGQLLEGSLYRDFQSSWWVDMRILGQPCEFYLIARRVSCTELWLRREPAVAGTARLCQLHLPLRLRDAPCQVLVQARA
jgi:hypothetical protein